jgi:L-amino acid N-acyltransferase YncA
VKPLVRAVIVHEHKKPHVRRQAVGTTNLRKGIGMKKKVTLKDGSEIMIRPLTKDDVERSLAFYRALPSTDRIYLRNDVMDRKIIQQRILDMARNREKALVAVSEDTIVADGSLELESHGWKQHRGEIRLVVARPFQRKGLGMVMARELYFLAASEKVQEIVVKMMRPQKVAQKIFKRLGFSEDVTLHGYVRDLRGTKQDMIIMRCDLKSLWERLEDYFTETDWERRK